MCFTDKSYLGGVPVSLMSVFDILGTIAFAILGALAGVEKKLDILGVLILELATAVGGGIIRDVVISNTPPVAFRNPLYVEVSILAAAAAYLLGSVSFAVVVSKGLYHQDVRQFGSGNAGMTNILRTYGKKAAALTAEIHGEKKNALYKLGLSWGAEG